jgi:ATP-dependent exoDNAse (exonuclease V) alpha subunit
VAGATRSIGGDGSIVECASLLGRGKRICISARQHVEEPAVRLLRPVGEGACQRVDENQGPAFADRERVTPQTKSEPERDRRRRQRVE